MPSHPPQRRPIRDLPPATLEGGALWDRLAGRRPAVFLDYDGTLTAIVSRPQDATIDEDVRGVIRSLAAVCPVAIISGRDTGDVRRLVDVAGITYAGSHGFDILGADGGVVQHGTQFLPALDAAEQRLRPAVAGTPGAGVERKRFAITVHFRQVDAADVAHLEGLVRDIAGAIPGLKVTGGKMVWEIRPLLDWDKGKALLSLLETLDVGGGTILPLYIGDDVTDEDAFVALDQRGVSLVVRGEDDSRPTAAAFSLADPAAVIGFLRALGERLHGREI